MTPIILAVGKGSRLKHLTENQNKPSVFVNFDNSSIIEKMLDNLNDLGVAKVMIAVGYLKDCIYNNLKQHYKNITIEYVEIKDWEENNNSYTVFQLKDKINDDFMIIEGDEYFNSQFITHEQLHDRNNYWIGTQRPITGCLLFADENMNLVDLDIVREKEKLAQLSGYYKSCGVVKITKEYKDIFFNGLSNFIHSNPENKKKYFDQYIKTDLDNLNIKVLPLSKNIIWGEVDDQNDLLELEAQFRHREVGVENFNKERRNNYWRLHKVFNTRHDNIYFLAGSDKDINKDHNTVSRRKLLYYAYRFAIENKLLSYCVGRYVKGYDRVLDFGCGTGRNSLVLNKYFKEVDSCDISSNFIDSNKERFGEYKKINFFVSGDDYDFGEDKYDAIFLGGVFMCMTNDEVNTTLIKLRRSLKDDGVLIIRDSISSSNTQYFDNIKIYRSEDDYESLLQGGGLVKKNKLNSANRNVLFSLYNNLPQEKQENKVLFNIFKLAIKSLIVFDLLFILRHKRFKRHPLSNQLFHIFKKK